MAGYGKIMCAAVLAATLAAPAFAQTPKALIAVQPQARPATTKASAGSTLLTNSWVCASGVRLEVYPVSYDAPTAAEQFVLVYKQGGKVVASERIDARTAKNVPGYGCDDHELLG